MSFGCYAREARWRHAIRRLLERYGFSEEQIGWLLKE